MPKYIITTERKTVKTYIEKYEVTAESETEAKTKVENCECEPTEEEFFDEKTLETFRDVDEVDEKEYDCE